MVSLWDRPWAGDQVIYRKGASPDRVKRCLFGKSDPEENRQSIQKELLEISAQDNIKWNFDFLKEMPLPGRFQWVPVRNKSSELSRTEELALQEEKETVEEKAEEDNLTKSSRQDRVRQSRITDFLPSRKRASTTKMSDGPANKKSSTESSSST